MRLAGKRASVGNSWWLSGLLSAPCIARSPDAETAGPLCFATHPGNLGPLSHLGARCQCRRRNPSAHGSECRRSVAEPLHSRVRVEAFCAFQSPRHAHMHSDPIRLLATPIERRNHCLVLLTWHQKTYAQVSCQLVNKSRQIGDVAM